MGASDECEVVVAEGATRRLRTLEEKLAILAEASQPGASVAAVARKHDVNANLVFGWRRLQRQGLLEDQRHAGVMNCSQPVLNIGAGFQAGASL